MLLPKFLSRKISPEKSLDFLSEKSVVRPALDKCRLILQGRLIAPFCVWRFCCCAGLLVRIPGLFCSRGVLRIFIERKLSNLSVLGSPQSPLTGGWLSWRVLTRPRPDCKNIWGEIEDCHVTAAARIVPHPFLEISVSDSENSSVPHTNFFVSVWYPTHSLSVWERNARPGN